MVFFCTPGNEFNSASSLFLVQTFPCGDSRSDQHPRTKTKLYGQSFLLSRKSLGTGTVHKNRHGGPFKTETPLWLKIISVLSDSKGRDTNVQVSNSDRPNFTYFIVFASISIKKERYNKLIILNYKWNYF